MKEYKHMRVFFVAERTLKTEQGCDSCLVADYSICSLGSGASIAPLNYVDKLGSSLLWQVAGSKPVLICLCVLQPSVESSVSAAAGGTGNQGGHKLHKHTSTARR